jgi:hypothetical protein
VKSGPPPDRHGQGKFIPVETEAIVVTPGPPKSKLTGGQKWKIAGLLFLQIPSSLIFYPLAAVFAITGIFVPIALVLMGVGSLPLSFAMKCRDRWQGSEVPKSQPEHDRPSPATI